MKRFITRLTIEAAFFTVLGFFAVVSYYVSRYEIDYRPARLASSDGLLSRALFSSEDDLRSLFISLIDGEKKRLRFAIYTFTDKDIAQAFIRAQQRGVPVEGVVDRSYGHSRYSKVCDLANAQLPIWVFQPRQEGYQGLMHNKFCIFDSTLDGNALVWTGSYNFTNNASVRNEENVVILDDRSIIEAFSRYFTRLQEKSLQISGQIHQRRPEKNSDDNSWKTRLGMAS